TCEEKRADDVPFSSPRSRAEITAARESCQARQPRTCRRNELTMATTVLKAPLARPTRAPLAIFLVALAVGLVIVLVGFRSQTLVDTKFDPYLFGEMGRSLARGDGFEPYGVLIKRRAPLYPLMIGAVYFVFGEQPMVVLLVQCLLLAGTCLLVLDI